MVILFLLGLGRVVLGAAFVVFGVRNLANLDRLTGVMEKRGLLPQPRLWIMLGIGIQIVGGVLVAINFLAWLGALALIGFLLFAAYLFHAFWEHPAGERTPHINAWIMNSGLSGAFLMVFALYPPFRF